jgi:hypothetical protein
MMQFECGARILCVLTPEMLVPLFQNCQVGRRKIKLLIVFPCNGANLGAIPCYYPGVRGHPTPANVASSWRLPPTQPSQVLANFEPTAAVLIKKLRLVSRNALREVWRAILR